MNPEQVDQNKRKEILKELIHNKLFLKQRVNYEFEEHDTDNSGFIEMGEFKTVLDEIKNHIEYEKSFKLPDSFAGSAESVLKKFDKNGDGKVSPDELRDIIIAMLEYCYEETFGEKCTAP
mmetsp:Transcript_49565/g.68821  ORF Transcript_49565/g.68821 Transcript_49565/m.68821 type:complete len:120 (-) Transcript_49565:32-391(-)